jgi:hypothetical protein
MEPSQARPGAMNVLIVGADEAEVQGEIFALEMDWPCITFMPPQRVPDGSCCAFGRVWKDITDVH